MFHTSKLTVMATTLIGLGFMTFGISAKQIVDGENARALEPESVVIGTNASETGEPDGSSSVVIGHNAKVDKPKRDKGMIGGDIAIGENARAKNTLATAVGVRATADGWGATAYGANAEAIGHNANAIGNAAKATGPLSSALGLSAKARGAYSISVGMSEAKGNISIAMGLNSKSEAANSTAIGNGAQSLSNDSIALGTNSVATTGAGQVGLDLSGTTHSDASDAVWRSQAGALSIGNTSGDQKVTRQITGLAAGTQDTDAVNVAQLKAAQVHLAAGNNVSLQTSPSSDGTTYTVHVNGTGKVASGDQGLITGDTLFKEARIAQDGKIIKAQSSVAENLSLLDQSSSANADAIQKLNSSMQNNVSDIRESVNTVQSDVRHLQSDMREVKKDIKDTGATAAALAALKPIQYDPNKPTQVMAGVGNYRGQSAVALGIGHYSSDSLLWHAGISMGEHPMVNAGITWKFGFDSKRVDLDGGRTVTALQVAQSELAQHEAHEAKLEADVERLKQRNQSLEQELLMLKASVQELQHLVKNSHD